MRTTVLLFLILFPIIHSHGQDYVVSGVIDGLSEELVYLADFRGDQHKVIDSTRTDPTGSFEISLSGLETGFYRLIFARQKFIDFMGKDICIGHYLADQILPYLCLARRKFRMNVSAITNHLVTNLWVIRKFFHYRIDIKGPSGYPGYITVEPE